MHEDLNSKTEVSLGSERAFGLVFSAVFAIVGLWPTLSLSLSLSLTLSGAEPRWWAMVLSVLFLITGLILPKLLKPLNKLWFKFGMVLHKVLNPLITGILFFLVVTPIGLLMRLRGKDFLRLRFDPDAESYWIERQPPGPAPDSLKKQF